MNSHQIANRDSTVHIYGDLLLSTKFQDRNGTNAIYHIDNKLMTALLSFKEIGEEQIDFLKEFFLCSSKPISWKIVSDTSKKCEVILCFPAVISIYSQINNSRTYVTVILRIIKSDEIM